jgi:carboxyvinyl-carboxyphosphonate phosphorylmutase
MSPHDKPETTEERIMGRWDARRAAYREVMAGSACVHPGSVFDPMSARIAQDIGFEVGMFAGSTASLTVLGAPDYIVLTLTEFADQCHRICRACELPLMVDADHGYGNALNVMRTVEELEAAGIGAMSVEDTDLPQPYGTGGKARMLSLEEGVGKMRAAVQARGETGLMIAGRTSAPAIAGVEEAVRRAKAYEASGVDAIFLVGVKSMDELRAIAPEITKPIILGSPPADYGDRAALAKLGVRVCLQGHQPIRAAVKAIHDTLKALRDGTRPSELTGLASGDLMEVATRQSRYDKAREDYL